MAASYAIFGAVSPPAPQALGNAAYAELWKGDTDQAVTQFRRALTSDAAFPYRWSDLGQALVDAGRTGEARYCFRRAVELGPESPQIAMRASNFYFLVGSIEDGLSLESKVLERTPAFDQIIFRSWTRMIADTSLMLDKGIGANVRAAGAFFDFLLAAGNRNDPNRNDLEETWRWIESRGYASPREGREWADWLLRSGAAVEAADVWAGHVAIDAQAYRKTDWIDNGSFERDWVGGGFDWNSVACPGVKASVDAAVAHTGARSLRLDVDSNENLDFHHFFQRTWMLPGRYRLEGWVRTSGFSTDQGIGLSAAQTEGTGAPAFTPAVSGTREWTPVATDLIVAWHPTLVEVRIVRQPSLDFDNHPRGTAWIDDVRVRRLP